MDETIDKCPVCDGRDFTVDGWCWSFDEPITIRERRVCDKCGKRLFQFWSPVDWEVTGSSPKQYHCDKGLLEVCPACKSEKLEIMDRYTPKELAIMGSKPGKGLLIEKYSCEKCGLEFVQMWKATNWDDLDFNLPEVMQCSICNKEIDKADEYVIEETVAGGETRTTHVECLHESMPTWMKRRR